MALTEVLVFAAAAAATVRLLAREKQPVSKLQQSSLAPPAHDSNPWTRTLTGALILTTTSAAMSARLDSQLLATFGPAVLACLLACCFSL